MFLVTTADQTTWRTDRPILFLGQWCLRYGQRDVWAKLDYEVLPYHWDDRGQFRRDYRYLARLNEIALQALTETLNAFHGTRYSLRYWRIVLGRWLYYFLHITFDRYRLIRAASESGKVDDTWVIDEASDDWLPRNMFQFHSWSLGDAYNHHLMGSIIRELGCLPYTTIPPGENRAAEASRTPYAERATGRGAVKRLRDTCARLYGRLAPAGLQRLALWGSGLEVGEQLALHLAMRQFSHYQAPPLEVPTPPRVDWRSRDDLTLEIGDDPYERLLATLLKRQMPVEFLEDYDIHRRRAAATLPAAPSVIFVGGSPKEDSGRYWVARQVERGAKLVMGQHGGYFGASLLQSGEDYDRAIADRYFSWGWQWPGDDDVVPLPSPKLSRRSRRLRPKPNGHVLWVLTSNPRYLHCIYSIPVAPQFLVYWREQERFARAASPDLRKRLLLRLYPKVDFGWDEHARWADSMPEIALSHGERTLEGDLAQARLFVGTYNATTPLEALAAGFPTVLFWTPGHGELRPQAQPRYDDLRRAGILHDTPESAATVVNEIHTDPQAWWRSPEIRAARERFCGTFARTGRRWPRDWRDALRALM